MPDPRSLLALPLVVMLLLGILAVTALQVRDASRACPQWKRRLIVFGLLGPGSFVVFFGVLCSQAIFPGMFSWNSGFVIVGSFLVAVLFLSLYRYYVHRALRDTKSFWV